VATPAELPPTSRPPVTTQRHKDSRVFACHVEPSHRLRCAVAFHHRCPPVSTLVDVASIGFRSRPLGDEALERAAPLAKLPLPNACRGGHCLALPARTRSHVGRVCWYSPSCHMARFSSDATSTSPPPAAKGQRHALVASTRGHHNNRSLRHLRLHVDVQLTGC
jgi:hypothetical protein